MSHEISSVYVIDPDEAVHDALVELLGGAGNEVRCFCSAEDFFESTDAQDVLHGCILTEADLPGMGSLAFLRQLGVRGCNIPVVVLTSTANRDIADQALKAGAVEVIPKPLVGDRLLKFLDDLEGQNAGHRHEQDGHRYA